MGNLLDNLIGDTCTTCFAEQNKISSISTNLDTLCFDHFVDWSDEKSYAEDWS